MNTGAKVCCCAHLDLNLITIDFRVNHHLWWGKSYRPSQLKPEWRVPSQEDIQMAFQLIGLATERVSKLEELISNASFGDSTWSNEFCRAINVIDKVLRGSYNLIAEIESTKIGGLPAPKLVLHLHFENIVLMQPSYLPPETLKIPPPFKSGLLLTQPDDPRYQQVLAFRTRVGEALHRSALVMRDAGESDNSVETVKLVVSTIGTFLTAYGIRSKQFGTAQLAYSGMSASKKLYESQRKQHRSILMAAVSIHHQNRLATLAFARVRSDLDDKLIRSMLNFCISPFMRIRRSAQSQLENIATLYRGTWVLCYPMLFDALKVGSDPDIMKGALYVLRYNHVGLSRIARDWRQLLPLTMCLLDAHHENKASVQALVTKATDELISIIQEPLSFDLNIRMEAVEVAVDALIEYISYKPDTNIIASIHRGLNDRIALQDSQWEIFIDRVLAVAEDSQVNWRYKLSACRYLLAVTRRDRPTDVRLARFFADNVSNPHPRIRDIALR